jgi:hypothetical protein
MQRGQCEDPSGVARSMNHVVLAAALVSFNEEYHP